MIEIEKPGSDKKSIKIKKKKEKKSVSKGVDLVHSSFYDQLKIAETNELQLDFDNLIEEITKQGEKFSKNPTYEELKRYKSMIKQFIKYATRKMLSIEHHTGGTRIKQKLYTLTRIIDKKLSDLTEIVMKGQTKNIQLLSKLDEIRGLLIDLYK